MSSTKQSQGRAKQLTASDTVIVTLYKTLNYVDKAANYIRQDDSDKIKNLDHIP